MSTHTYIRAGGVWATNTALLSAEMAAFDAAQFDSVSASGGVYAPAAQIEIGGSGLKLSGTGHTITGTVTLTTGTFTTSSGSTVNFGAGTTLSLNANWTSGGNATFNGSITANGTATFNGNVTLGDTSGDLISIPGNFVSSGPAAFTGNLNIGDASSDLLVVASTPTFQAAATFQAPIILSNSGGIRMRVVNPANSNINITPRTADIYSAVVGSLTAARTWTISDTNCADGDWILLQNLCLAATAPVTVNDPTSTFLITLQGDAGSVQCAIVFRTGGAWRAMRLS